MTRDNARTASAAILAALCSVATPALRAQQAPPEARLLRFPHLQKGRIAFVHGGDIWTASSAGGIARRLTSWDQGFELFPRISPDGSRVAFSAEYSGTRQVWVAPFDGGTPVQLTFYPDVGPMPPRGGYDNLVFDWTPDGAGILVRCNRTPYGDRIGRYFVVDPDGGLERPLQIPEGGPATFAPDGKKLAYNIISREWRTWKRYSAGRQQDVFVYDLEQDAIEQITDWRGTDSWPMWLGGTIYFTSDRAHGTLNLFAYDVQAKTTRQVSDFRDQDVLFPARGDDGVIFERGGELWIMEAGSEALRKLTITLADDRPWARPVWHEGASRAGDHALSPDGARVLVEFRGELFTVPAHDGPGEELTRTPDRREMQPRWSPDGRHIAFLAEAGDDYELVVKGLELGEEVRVTDGTGAWILGFEWLPDGEALVFVDKRSRLMRVDVRTRSVLEIDRSPEGPIRSLDVSRDGAWLCYVKPGANGHDAVWLCPAERSAPVRVTSEQWSSGSPAFDPRGELLYVTSARDYVHDGHRFDQRIWAHLLRRDVADPRLPREAGDAPRAGEDRHGASAARGTARGNARGNAPGNAPGTARDGTRGMPPGDSRNATPARGDRARGAESPALRIDLDGLGERAVPLPGIAPGRYSGLVGVDAGVLFQRDGKLELWQRTEREVATVLAEGGGFRFTHDREHVVYRSGGRLHTSKVTPGAKGKPVPLDDVRVRVEPEREWAQMYRDAWRIMRDWFYDPNMHGVDWVAMRRKHAALLPHVAHRSDLDFLLGELIGELNAGHTYVLPGETPEVERAPVGVLGCELEADARHDRIRIGAIFDGDGARESTRNPLRDPSSPVATGDWLIAIDGHELTARDNPYRFLDGKVGRPVRLLVNSRPVRAGAREVVVRPAASEVGLRYITWVNRNRRLVAELSGGRIGYVHVPDTAIDGHRELFAGWRAQARVAEAMIVDDRYNGGGFIPDDLVFEVAKPVLSFWSRRHQELSTTPSFGFDGPRAMLINGYSSSGGDAFPYYFRKLGLGKLLGRTTWGGLIGYSGTPQLVDGGGLAVPSFAFVNTAGQWDVEAIGVAPDVEVFDDPTLIVRGREPMLEAAVQHLLAELEKRPPVGRPPTPAGPIRDRVLEPGQVSR